MNKKVANTRRRRALLMGDLAQVTESLASLSGMELYLLKKKCRSTDLARTLMEVKRLARSTPEV